MNLPAELVAYLRSEAYVTLCQQSLEEALAKIEQDKQELMATRPAFGVLAPKSAREAYKTSLRSVLDNEEGLRQRLGRLAPLTAWLEPLIRPILHKHLIATSEDYQYYEAICEAVRLWQLQVTALGEKGVAFARDARAAADAIAGRAEAGRGPRGLRLTRAEALAALHATTVSASFELADLARTAARVTPLSADELPEAVRLPAVPQFRTAAWVDELATLPDRAAVGELETFEAEARIFAKEGLRPLLERGAATEAACVRLRQDYLQAFLQEAREYALGHYVEERNLDDVLVELTAHHVADVQRRHRDLIHNSFEFAGAR